MSRGRIQRMAAALAALVAIPSDSGGTLARRREDAETEVEHLSKVLKPYVRKTATTALDHALLSRAEAKRARKNARRLVVLRSSAAPSAPDTTEKKAS